MRLPRLGIPAVERCGESSFRLRPPTQHLRSSQLVYPMWKGSPAVRAFARVPGPVARSRREQT